MTRRAEGGLGPEGGGPTACCAATAAAAATALEAVEAFKADEDGVVVVASAAVAAAAAAAADAEEELLALVSNIPGGEGSIAAHPNTLPSQTESGKQHAHNPGNVYSRQLSPVSSAVFRGPRVAL